MTISGIGHGLSINNGNLSVNGDATFNSKLQLNGELATIDSTNLRVEDALVQLNYNAASVSGTRDMGIFGVTNSADTTVVSGIILDGSDSIWKAAIASSPGNDNYLSITGYRTFMANNFISKGVRVLAANGNSTIADSVVIMTSDATTLTLHAANSTSEGQSITVIGGVNVGHSVTVSGVTALGGANTITLLSKETCTLVSANGGWYVSSLYKA